MRNKMKKQLKFVTIIIAVCLMLLVTNIVTIIMAVQKPMEAESKTASIQTEYIVVEKEVPVQITMEADYTYDELYCIAVVIYNEAGGSECTDEQRELVGYVVLNRVNDSRYPDTIREVLEQPGQYAGLGTNGINFAKRSSNPNEAASLERAWKTAQKVLDFRNEIPIPENVVFQAEFKQGTGLYKQIGNTYFCY